MNQQEHEVIESPRPVSHIVFRILLGLALLSVLAWPGLALFCGGAKMSLETWFTFPKELNTFFGNWAAVWLLLGFMAFLPLFGTYLIVEGAIRVASRSRGAAR